MAGGKETPRQKLIGMMYLVLLALLALQVSSAILEKFKFLDDSLKLANEAANKNNLKVQKSIEKTIQDAGNKVADVVVLEKAKKIREHSSALKKHLEDLRNEIITLTEGYEDGPGSMYKGAKEETKIEILMIGAEGSHKGKGYELKNKINAFCDELTVAVKGVDGAKVFPHLALDAKDDERISKTSDQRKKDFAELNFGQTPMVAAMASLSNIEAECLKHETDALAILQTAIGAGDIKFDNIFAMYRADSRVVAAGTKYVADLFLAASSSAIKPTMSRDGSPLVVSADGKGKVEFTATGGSYDNEGNCKKKWKGSITFKNKGKDTTFIIDADYVVAKPVIQVQSASVSALYKNCGNELNVQVPALGALYDPNFVASGATAIKGAKKGYVTLVPTSPEVGLKISSNGNFIGEEKFKVRLIPKPQIVALDGGKPVDEKRGLASPGPSAITIRAIPDESFANFLPNDARYKVTEWEAILVRGKRPVSTKNFSTELGSFSDFRAKAQEGDRIVIEVKSVKRMNFKGEIENVSLGTIIKNIPLN